MYKMDESPTMLYPTSFPLIPIIPAAIRRRMPRLYSFKLKTDIDDTAASDYRGVASSSEPQLAYYRPMNDSHSPTQDVLRPATAEDRDSSDVSDISISDESYTPTPLLSKYEARSGIRWNRVVPAFHLLRNAGFEAQRSHSDIRLVRSLYITAVGYLLDALPADLTEDETRSVTHKLPTSVQSSIPTPNKVDLVSQGSPPPSQQSYIHRLLASIIIQFFLFLQFLLPYVKIFLRQMYQYERSHRITERLVTATVDVADSLGKGGISLGSAVLGLQEGRVGVVLGDLISWWVEGIAGGIHEGIGEGMMILGVVRSDNSTELDGSPMSVGCR